jgi:hypothetical protein
MTKDSGLAAVRAAAMDTTSAAAIVANSGGDRGDRAPPAETATAPAQPAPKMVGMPESEYKANLSAANAEGRAAGAKAASTRIKSIITAPEAKGRESLAHSIAFDTELSHEQAMSMLKAAPEAPKVSRLDGHVPAPKVDASESGTQAETVSAGLGAAVQRLIAKKTGTSAAH